jgi:hypothetical protein
MMSIIMYFVTMQVLSPYLTGAIASKFGEQMRSPVKQEIESNSPLKKLVFQLIETTRVHNALIEQSVLT